MDEIRYGEAKIEKIVDFPFYTEGPAKDSKNNVYFTTLAGGAIMKLDSNGRLTEWARSACPNGQVVLDNDEHLICDSKLGSIRRFGSNGKFIKDEIKGFCAGFKLFTPNDLVVDHYGNIYFSDSVRYTGKVCFLGINGEQCIISDNLDYPNGLVLSDDERWLYVAESFNNRIIRIELRSLERKINILSELPQNNSDKEDGNLPDGLAIDPLGRILIAHYGMQALQILSTSGSLLSSVNVGLPLTSNVIFFDKRTLIVTGGYGEPGPGAVMKIYL